MKALENLAVSAAIAAAFSAAIALIIIVMAAVTYRGPVVGLIEAFLILWLIVHAMTHDDGSGDWD